MDKFAAPRNMDYTRITIFIILAIISPAINGIANHNRDIILSPNKDNHHPGKIIYYHPELSVPTANGNSYSTIANSEASATAAVAKLQATPWEDALKYSTYLAFRDRGKHDYQHTSSPDSSNYTSFPNNQHHLPDIRVLHKADYIPQDSFDNLQKFGDIVMLARGKLQKTENNQLMFVESNLENCEINKLCPSEFANTKDSNLLALWMIEKIRHRNTNHGHRFEMRITIMPNNHDQTTSFILRDIDYPNMFVNHEANRQNLRKSKINRSFFDFADFYKNSPVQHNYRPQLNTGEYYVQRNQHFPPPPPPPTIIPENYVYQHKPTVPFSSSKNVLFPTTAFDQYNQLHQLNQYRIPETTTQIFTNKLSEQPPPSTTTHLHHHFYVKDTKAPTIQQTNNDFDHQPQFQHRPQQHFQQLHQFIGDHRGITDPEHAPRLTTNYEISPHQTQKPEFNTFETPQHYTDQIPIPPRFQIQQQPTPIHQHQHNQVLQIPQPNHYHQSHQHQQQGPHQQQVIQIPVNVPYVFHQPQYYQPQNIPVTTVQYMQQIQIPPYQPLGNMPSSTYHPNHDHHNTLQTPFHESPQYIEQPKYSEADPIYHPDIYRQNYPDEYYRTSLPTPAPHTESISSINGLAEEPKHNFEVINTKESDNHSTHYKHENHHDSNQKSNDHNYPDSINAQLPPPDRHTDVNVPYVETSVVTQKSVSAPLIIVPSVSVHPNHLQETPSSSNYVKTESSESKTTKSKVNTRQSLRQQIERTTTEKPVLKWMPKRTKLQRISSTSSPNATTTNPKEDESEKIEIVEPIKSISSKLYSSKVSSSSTTTTDNYITVTPSTTTTTHPHEPTGMESQTRKSFSTSISVEIGDKRHKLFHDLKPTIKLNGIGRNDFDKPANNKIEMIKADIQPMNTNSAGMQLFRASDEESEHNKGTNDDVNLDPIALSIIQHAKSIARH